VKDFKENLKEIYPKLQKHAIFVASKDDIDYGADDLVQMTIVKGLQNQHQFNGEYLLSWLKTIMFNITIDDYRRGAKVELKGEDKKRAEAKGEKPFKRKKRFIRYDDIKRKDENQDQDNDDSFDDTYKPESPLASELLSSSFTTEQDKEDDNERKSLLYSAINKMDGKCREILLLFTGGWEYQEMSERLSVPIGTVENRLFRCRKKLYEMAQKKQLIGEKL